jgi:hypothetical protein
MQLAQRLDAILRLTVLDRQQRDDLVDAQRMSPGGGDEFHGLADPEFVLGQFGKRISAPTTGRPLHTRKRSLSSLAWLGLRRSGMAAVERHAPRMRSNAVRIFRIRTRASRT